MSVCVCEREREREKEREREREREREGVRVCVRERTVHWSSCLKNGTKRTLKVFV